MLTPNDILDIELRNRGNADVATLLNQIELINEMLQRAKRHWSRIDGIFYTRDDGTLEQDEDYIALDRLLDEVP